MFQRIFPLTAILFCTLLFSVSLSAQTPTPTPIWGYADVHNHQFANLGFGGLLVWGKPFDPGGIGKALPHCDYNWDVFVVDPFGFVVLPLPLFGNPVHGAWGSLDLIGMALDQGLGHGAGGNDEFDAWPRWSTATHQQVYMDWLYRAHQGGLQLMVMQTVNNSLLCAISNQQFGFGCNDMVAVDRQIQGAKDMEAYIDGLSGGSGQGWYRIVYTPQEARQAIANGQLAVVLGIEVDNLFNCTTADNCTTSDLNVNLKKYYDAGVRHLFPVHVFDNGFGGAALYNGAFNAGNRLVDGYWFNAYDCSGDGYEFKLGHSTLLGDLAATVLPGIAPPIYSGAGQCNSRGLTPLGATLIKKMMALKMIIDVDHMSANMMDSALTIAESKSYPVVAGHTGFLDISIGEKRGEGQKTPAQMERLRKLGALVAPILEQGKTSEISPFLDPVTGAAVVPDNCSKSSSTWAQAYLYALNAMQGAPIALGTDFNGLAGEPGPRFGSEACTGGDPSEGTAQNSDPNLQRVNYPFQIMGSTASMDKSVVGKKTFDFNIEGLAHVGLLPDFIADLRAQGVTDAQLTPLFHSAEAYIQLWEKIQNSNNFAPTVTYSLQPSPNADGWNNSDATLSLGATEDPDGFPIAALTYSAGGAETISETADTSGAASLVINVEGTTNVSFSAADTAGGNSGTQTVTIKLDKSAPSVVCASADGQWHSGNVQIGCSSSDAVSGLANLADAAFVVTTGVAAGVETANAATGSYSVKDVAGNQAAAGPIGGNRIDRKPPVITIVSPANANYVVNQAVAANYGCADGGSGVATCAGPVLNGSNFSTSAPGTSTFTVNSTDNVGNASNQSVSYGVSYNICLLYDPTKAKNGGSTYPIKLQLCDANNANLSSGNVVVQALSVTIASTSAPGVLDDAGNSNPDNDFRYDSSLGGYIFNLSTRGFATGTYRLNFKAGNDPVTHSVAFQVK